MLISRKKFEKESSHEGRLVLPDIEIYLTTTVI